ncbi:unnamed protein product [Callosobruchus maculatus]|uniref:Uncharacterized protein n=2 Tax=Callosobruchus maculatus TaxID=64391 RepID=A0A653DIH0_CALMS|nr:unnamed protein product [Callosobruchus maculatus]VEN59320.1 unnamed protein product [Callosobruchus maculatus]VEN59322.1 unnamed protein product [Callosobruchus maculatus]
MNDKDVTVKTAVIEKVEEELAEILQLMPQANGIAGGDAGKKKKKKKNDLNIGQKLTAERDELINSVRNAELSKSEVQLLIDMLLNKQLEAPNVDDWNEDKSNPVVKLKRQLAEKERLLAEEKEALAGAQAKLREVRAERQTERSQFRALEEVLKVQQQESHQINQRLQVTTQKVNQLQAELNAEIIRKRKLLEDHSALQVQVQRYEVSLAQISETDAILVKLRNDVEQFSAQNQQLQQIIAEKERQNQHCLMQLANMEKSLEQEKEIRMEIERNLEKSLRMENEWKLEISKANTSLQQKFEEKRMLEHRLDQLQDDLRMMKNEKNDGSKIIAQLKFELQQLQDNRLKEGDQRQDDEQREVAFLNLTNELSSIKNELSSVKSELELKEKKFTAELESTTRNCNQLQKELDDQKAKNNELRTKNWKVMEALKAAENNANAASNNKQTDVNKLTNELIQKEREAQKQFIERLFPDISHTLKKVTYDDWQTECNRLISSYVERLKKGKESTNGRASSPQKSQDVAKLQAQLLHYKNIIDDTEGMLNKLQCHIESEEIKWRNELAAKQAEIERLKKDTVKVAQDNTSALANGPAHTEVSFIRNTNICSNLGCQFLYCDGVSCSREC